MLRGWQITCDQQGHLFFAVSVYNLKVSEYSSTLLTTWRIPLPLGCQTSSFGMHGWLWEEKREVSKWPAPKGSAEERKNKETNEKPHWMLCCRILWVGFVWWTEQSENAQPCRHLRLLGGMFLFFVAPKGIAVERTRSHTKGMAEVTANRKSAMWDLSKTFLFFLNY